MYDYNQKPDLNITPLVDIMLVLLAILIVTTPVVEYEEQINLPRGSKTKQVQDFSKIDILITKDRKVKINKKQASMENFADTFLLLSNGKNKDVPVYIKADKTLEYNDIIFILKSVKEAGFLKVSLVTDG